MLIYMNMKENKSEEEEKEEEEEERYGLLTEAIFSWPLPQDRQVK